MGDDTFAVEFGVGERSAESISVAGPPDAFIVETLGEGGRDGKQG